MIYYCDCCGWELVTREEIESGICDFCYEEWEDEYYWWEEDDYY
jgi:hypothetical protein